ncbi:hypothetical protein [Dyadobacter crusticola]|uniref:hypothetical protein n=1 Tax=Dyadobacter crusticola TaxID=292407 RepID=UPI0004E2495C|nr:hypothetical protein [Dyadobacter crusticola]
MINHIRVDVGAFGIQRPGFSLANRDFDVFTNGVGVKVDYLLRKQEGFFLGVQSDFATDRIGLKSEAKRENKQGVTLGVRGG